MLSTWRTALGPAPLAGLQARLLAAVGAEHRDHDYRAVHVGDSGHELYLGSIYGSVTRVPDTDLNRAAFGSTGTADYSAPYPQVRDLLASDASTRGTLAVASGPSGGPKAEGEQALLDTMLTTCRQIFTADRLWVLDRNFPGADRVARMLATGTHVLIRVKSDLTLPRISGFLPDGSYHSYLAGSHAAGRWCMKVRVIEYDVDVDGQDTGEMFCLISDLLDHVSYPARQLAAAYAWRWTGPETSLKEAKSAITGAGPSACLIFRSQAPELIAQEHAAWICGTELVRALARAAARHAGPPAGAASPDARSSPARSPSPPPAAPPWPASAPAPPPRSSACAYYPGLPPRHPARPRQAPHRHRPPPAPRPQDQSPPGLPRRRARHHHPHRDRTGQRLPAGSGLTRITPAGCHRSLIPARTRRIWNRPPARSDTRATGLPITLRNQNPAPSRCTQNAVTNADHAEVHGIVFDPVPGTLHADTGEAAQTITLKAS